MKFTQDFMDEIIGGMIYPDERLACSVYCAFKQTGFFASNKAMYIGFAAVTDKERLLCARAYWGMGEFQRDAFALSAAQKLTVKKSLLGTYQVYAEFPSAGKKQKIKFQVSPKVYDCDFPNQKRDAEVLLEILRKYGQ
ncbi:MAG: hypothetical protein NC253_13545 [Ruminococcus sp.]|nr:hypothetical protein [Ruminococcus sp.]MCM1382454.1 hypothetical protein [Muribaculaceae bacterium]MCM1480656.1 hypothetical protein [Muribaculaceae bacterium]